MDYTYEEPRQESKLYNREVLQLLFRYIGRYRRYLFTAFSQTQVRRCRLRTARNNPFIFTDRYSDALRLRPAGSVLYQIPTQEL